MNHKTMIWESVTFTRTGKTVSIDPPLRCDGCEVMVQKTEEFVGTDPLGAKIAARWCTDCVAEVEATQSH